MSGLYTDRMDAYLYPGTELELFAHAHKWKAYLASRVRPYIRGEVLEVGAGLGTTTRALCDERYRRWTCLEPDSRLAALLAASLTRRPLSAPVDVKGGTLVDLPTHERFDTVLYVDVLEHIEDDKRELDLATDRLSPGGAIVVVAPAFRFLYSVFDRHVGHYRRYSLKELLRLAPRRLVFERGFYLDAVGAALSLGNRFLLKSGCPSGAQIAFWDSVIIPLSRRIDPLIGRRFGRAVVVVWRYFGDT